MTRERAGTAMSIERTALERAFGHALTHLESLDTRPVAPPAGLEAPRRALHRPLPEAGTNAAQVVDELVADAADGVMGSQSGRFFAWVIGGSLPAAMAADWLTTAGSNILCLLPDTGERAQ